MTPIIDLIAGMVFIYFLLAIVNNSCMELYASFVQLRSTMLKHWIEKNFGSAVSKLTHQAYAPYIHSKTFAQQVRWHLCPPQATASLTDALSKSAIPDATKNLLQGFAEADAQKKSSNETGHFEKQVEQWFDLQMDQLTAIYKRRVLWFTFAFASVITIALNVDTLQLANFLYQNPEARAQWAAAANAVPADSASTPLRREVIIATANLPIGWPDANFRSATKTHLSFWYYLRKSGGLLITILAICLGAPFWFDVLNKVANLRSGKKPLNASL